MWKQRCAVFPIEPLRNHGMFNSIQLFIISKYAFTISAYECYKVVFPGLQADQQPCVAKRYITGQGNKATSVTGINTRPCSSVKLR